MAETTERLRAADLVQAIKGAGIRFIVALPDRTTSEHLLKPLMQKPELRVVQICKEDGGVSICSGLYATGQRALRLRESIEKSRTTWSTPLPARRSTPRPQRMMSRF